MDVIFEKHRYVNVRPIKDVEEEIAKVYKEAFCEQIKYGTILFEITLS